MVIVIMGVAGAGKTTIGSLLASDLGWKFFDADDFHSPANIEKMRAGLSLTEADREPWLAALHALLQRLGAIGTNAVLACSALQSDFRRRLSAGIDVRFVHLRARPEVIADRLEKRQDHFASPSLLPSQFATLEEPEEALVLDASSRPDELVAAIRKALKV